MGVSLVTGQNMTRDKCCKYELNENLHGIKREYFFSNFTKTLIQHTVPCM